MPVNLTGIFMLKLLPWELSHYLVYRLMNIEDVPLHDYVIGSLIYMLGRPEPGRAVVLGKQRRSPEKLA